MLVTYETRIRTPQAFGSPKVEIERHVSKQEARQHINDIKPSLSDKSEVFLVEVKEKSLASFVAKREVNVRLEPKK